MITKEEAARIHAMLRTRDALQRIRAELPHATNEDIRRVIKTAIEL